MKAEKLIREQEEIKNSENIFIIRDLREILTYVEEMMVHVSKRSERTHQLYIETLVRKLIKEFGGKL